MSSINIITIIFYIFTDSSIINVQAIIGGRLVVGNTFSYQGALIVKADAVNKREPVGSATIIDPKFVLTTAVCVFNKSASFYERWYEVLVGTKNLLDNRGIVVQIDKMYLSGNFNTYNQANNTVVIQLETSLDLSANSGLRKVDLPPLDQRFADSKAIFSAYGYSWVQLDYSLTGKAQIIDGDTNWDLKYLTARVLDNDICRRDGFKILDSQLCAKTIPLEDGQQWGACKEDWGGPLVVNNSLIIGLLTAICNDCSETYCPGIYTRIISAKPFIESILNGTPADNTLIHIDPAVSAAA